jgi:hypothetical protein
MSPAEHQIEDAIEAAGNPPEQAEPLTSETEPGDAEERAHEGDPPDPGSEWRTWSGRTVNP